MIEYAVGDNIKRKEESRRVIRKMKYDGWMDIVERLNHREKEYYTKIVNRGNGNVIYSPYNVAVYEQFFIKDGKYFNIMSKQ